MYALEDLRNKVRTPRSRKYVDEAVRAYNAAAYRSAIMATWIAVAADLIDKIRTLAVAGESAAKALQNTLETAIQRNDIAGLQRFERELLDVAKDRLHLLGEREHTELERLYRDRHLCAHPAFSNEDDGLFSPTPELVRAHMTAAVDGLLSQGPVVGRKAIERFKREITADSFPSRDEALREYLLSSYLQPGTQPLRANLIKVVFKMAIQVELDPPVRWRAVRTAQALQVLVPREWEEHAHDLIDRLQDDWGDDVLLCVVTGLCHVPGVWEELRPGPRNKLEQLFCGELPLEVIVHLADPLPPAPLDKLMARHLDDLIAKGFVAEIAISGDPDPRLVAPLIEILRKVTSYQHGADVLEWIAALAQVITPDQLREIIQISMDNSQIRDAFIGRRALRTLRSATEERGQVFADAWQVWEAGTQPTET
ncbi:hypothetical protein [Actinomadura rayongensis]|uniref:Uncharacterized protein n=1 Tax=Actinomadura rayongensis TaxID=1429076 RepID=A0A6I4WF80_9ACTN|nr:hypothetical protein [Actinomadura rayongensis]MXQ65584.1 hypothetical protein [Actinomadura rayongensis]